MGNDNEISKWVFLKGRLIVIAFAAAVAVLQGNYYTSIAFGADRQLQTAVIFTLGLFIVAFFAGSSFAGKLTDDARIVYCMLGGMLMRSYFVLMSDIWTLQNDTGTYTGIATDQINIGHIGYIEYIYKFGHLPDMDPYEVFGYFHPPVHHLIEALWLTLQRFIGVPEELAFENLQVPTLIYSGFCMLVMLHILKELGVSGKKLFYGMALFGFYPRMMVFAGSVNNDILALLLLMTTIWRAIAWCREKNFRNIILLALALGGGMLVKLNTAICAFALALIFLIYFIETVRSGNLVLVKNTVLQYLVFGAVAIPVGCSFLLRNLIVFHRMPGLPTQGESSVMYTGGFSLWSRIGIPSLYDSGIEFPFHPISGEACHNAWVILFETGIFAESYPADIVSPILALAQIAYVASIVTAILATIAFFVIYGKKTFGEKSLAGLFLLSTYLFMLVSFVLYEIKYPYTCSGDFRYMAATLVFTSLGYAAVGAGADELAASGNRVAVFLKDVLRFIMNTAMAATLVLSAAVWLTIV